MTEFLIPERFRRNGPAVRAMGPPAFTGRLLLDYLLTRLNWSSFAGKTMLDFGCGSRFTSAILTHDLPIGAYIGVDIDRDMIDWLASNVTDPRFSYYWNDEQNPAYGHVGRQMPVDCLPIGPQTADVATMFSVITHQQPDDARKIFRRLHLYTKPRAYMFFSAAIHGGPEPNEELPYKEVPEQHFQSFRRDYLQALLDATGWQIVSAADPAPVNSAGHVVPIAHSFLCARL
jgi:SAM-dependent methyltransferase